MGPPRRSASQRIIVMKLHEALAIADQVKPARRASFDKLTAGDFSARAEALSKRFDELSDDIAGIRKSLLQMLADLDHCENRPGEKRRIIN
jgi:hypothetical protein